MDFEKEVNELILSRRFKFKDWGAEAKKFVPDVAPGVYLVWKDDKLIYAGMSGKKLTSESIKEARDKISERKKAGKNVTMEQRKGLFKRLNSHASGRLSGDQFCVYVANRYIAPEISVKERKALKLGVLTFDDLAKKFIEAHFEYSFIETESGEKAMKLEKEILDGNTELQKPYLNS